MPIPFLLAGLGVAAAAIGAGGHLSAKDTNERAQRISEEAKEIYDDAKRSLEKAQGLTEKKLLSLGYEKKNVLDTSMHQFLDTYDKIKHIQVNESIGVNEISKFAIDTKGALEIRQMTDIYSSSIKSGATGAAAGAVVALAASGSLSVVTGTLATAGSALIAGEIGAAASLAGSALSFGAAMTPLAAVVAPVVLFTGISASVKADENLEKANAMYAEAEVAVEKMKVSETLCNAISERSEMFNELLENLNGMFSECTGLLAGVVKKKEGKLFKKQLKSSDFSEDDLKLVAVTRALAGAIKAVIDTPMLSQDGSISYESTDVYKQTVERLPDFCREVEEVKQLGLKVKPVQVNVISTTTEKTRKKGGTKGSLIRRVFSFILGFILARNFAVDIALAMYSGEGKYLFIDENTANSLAIWVLICTSVMWIVGKFQGTKIGKCCLTGTGISLVVLYTLYCRSVELREHYIIFSIMFLIVCFVVFCVFAIKQGKWACAEYLCCVSVSVGCYPILFLIYALFTKFFGFSENFWMVVTSLLMAFMSLIFMSIVDDE